MRHPREFLGFPPLRVNSLLGALHARSGQGMVEYAIVAFLLAALGSGMMYLCHEIIKYYNWFSLLISIPIP